MLRIGNKSFEFDKDYELIAKVDRDSLIRNYIISNHGIYIPQNFSTEWVVTEKNEYGTGKLPKRLNSFIGKEYGQDRKLSEEALGRLSNYYNSLITKEDKYIIQFTQTFWKKSFADGSSCWHKENKGAPLLIQENGGGFIKIFKDSTPYGRAAYLPYKEDGLIVFNTKGSMSLNSLSELFKHNFNINYSTGYGSNAGKKGFYHNVLYFDTSLAVFTNSTDKIDFKKIISIDETGYSSTEIMSSVYVLQRDLKPKDE